MFQNFAALSLAVHLQKLTKKFCSISLLTGASQKTLIESWIFGCPSVPVPITYRDLHDVRQWFFALQKVVELQLHCKQKIKTSIEGLWEQRAWTWEKRSKGTNTLFIYLFRLNVAGSNKAIKYRRLADKSFGWENSYYYNMYMMRLYYLGEIRWDGF